MWSHVIGLLTSSNVSACSVYRIGTDQCLFTEQFPKCSNLPVLPRIVPCSGDHHSLAAKCSCGSRLRATPTAGLLGAMIRNRGPRKPRLLCLTSRCTEIISLDPKTVSRLQHKSSADSLTNWDGVFKPCSAERGRIFWVRNDHLLCPKVTSSSRQQ
jgi:hypothetical protein